MHMRVQGAHGPRQIPVAGHRRVPGPVPHKHHVLLRSAFRRQMADEGQSRFGHVLRTGQQGRAHMADKALLRGHFIHGGADDFVPCSMSRENYAACTSEKELLIIPGATHAMCYYYDTPAYAKAVTDFLKKHM